MDLLIEKIDNLLSESTTLKRSFQKMAKKWSEIDKIDMSEYLQNS